MRDLYDWMERLLLMACSLSANSNGSRALMPDLNPAQDDVVKLTWKLFDSMAQATRHHSLHRAIRQCNDRLAPIRRAKHGLLDDPLDEYQRMLLVWKKGDPSPVRRTLKAYFARRKALVPHIVDRLNEISKRVH
ncbi:hypothetical protein BGP89_14185 [Luteimonas sp. JM171]|uniref:hypothetical protein n=1 Tax=Luteimonas sp. JM171 TaxID=1896164 RepID=UPI001F42DE1F|nr:hypothetical protein [Luteimonas sp. JM171]